MAIQRTGFFLGLVAIQMALWGSVSGQSNGCTGVLVSLSPCLNYISGNSTSPSPSCCSQLATTVRSQPQCLCQVLSGGGGGGGGGSTMGIPINQTQALALPGACKLQTPPISSTCNGAASPSGSASDTPVSNTPSGTGSKTLPTSEGGSSDGSSTKVSMSLLFFAFLAVAYASA